MDKRYEILDGLPTYGDMAIPITYNNEILVSEGYVVKFYKDNGTDWIANFQLGWIKSCQVIANKYTNIIIVIADGAGYIMNPNKTEPIRILDYSIYEIIQMDSGSFIIASDSGIMILDKNGELEWESEYQSWDGIKDLKLNENILTGYAYDIFAYEELDENSAWIKFTVNLDTKEIEGGKYIIPEFEVSEKKLGWKYWVFFILAIGAFQIWMNS